MTEPAGMICKTCKSETLMLSNGQCTKCYTISVEKWQTKMAIRMPVEAFDMRKLVNLLLTQHWMHECTIISDYMPPFPRENTQPKCVVRFVYPDGEDTYLRYSQGPAQGYFWDAYGEDMHRPELALIALSLSPPPPRIDYVIPTHGN